MKEELSEEPCSANAKIKDKIIPGELKGVTAAGNLHGVAGRRRPGKSLAEHWRGRPWNDAFPLPNYLLFSFDGVYVSLILRRL